MTDHPAKGCTKAQFEAFERIAIGNDSMVNPKTAKSLVAKGLIEERLVRLGGPLHVIIKRYTVPIKVHWQWCEWCAEQDGGEE